MVQPRTRGLVVFIRLIEGFSCCFSSDRSKFYLVFLLDFFFIFSVSGLVKCGEGGGAIAYLDAARLRVDPVRSSSDLTSIVQSSQRRDLIARQSYTPETKSKVGQDERLKRTKKRAIWNSNKNVFVRDWQRG